MSIEEAVKEMMNAPQMNYLIGQVYKVSKKFDPIDIKLMIISLIICDEIKKTSKS